MLKSTGPPAVSTEELVRRIEESRHVVRWRDRLGIAVAFGAGPSLEIARARARKRLEEYKEDQARYGLATHEPYTEHEEKD